MIPESWSLTSASMLGIVVDAVSEVFRVPATRLLPPPTVSTFGNNYLTGLVKLPTGS